MRIAPDLQETLENTIQSSLLKLQADINVQAGRVSELEHRVSSLEDENAAMSSKLCSMVSNMSQITNKLEDLENRSRRNNLRMVGLPESILMQDLQKMCEIDLPRKLGMNHPCRVERAHRIGRDDSNRSRSGDSDRPTPRQVIMRFLDYNDKQDIIRSFRKRSTPLMMKGTKILLFEDFSADVARRRREYSAVCSLYERKVRFRIIYPATLLVTPDGKPPQKFTSATEAEKVMTSLLASSQRNTDDYPSRTKSRRQGTRPEGSPPTSSSRSSPVSPKDQRQSRRADPENST